MLVTPAIAKAHGDFPDSEDDATLALLLAEAEAAIGAEYDLPTVPKATETRTVFADGQLVWLDECVSVTAVTDTDNVALTYETRAGIRPGDFLRGIVLDARYLGHIKVTGQWGFDATPADVIRAICVTALTYLKRQTFGSDDAPYRGGGDSIPTEARKIMSARRVRF